MPKLSPFYVVVCDDGKDTYTYENDWIALPIDRQWETIVGLVASGEWDDVSACYLVHPVNGTCEDKLIDLANAVDASHERENEDPSDYIREWIEHIIGANNAFMRDDTRARIHQEQRVDYAIDIARGK
jgi:D-alanyl-D-alanine carboxypeptidase